MKKKYIANSQIAINVVLPSGKSAHVAFSSVTGGSSIFYTEDEQLQQAIESHYRYGKLFKGQEVTEPEIVESEEPEEEKGPTIVNVSDVDAAKDYLSEKYGISRTKLKTVAAINKAAAANGIEFSWEE